MKIRVLLVLFIFIFFAGLFYFEYVKIKVEPITSWKIENKADCAVVLTGGPGRVREGFDLLSRKTVKRLILSGVYPNAHMREVMPMLPFYGEIEEEDIFIDRRSGTTWGNAQQTLPIVEALHCKDILLVTSQLHMHRAFSVFRSAYPEKISIYKHSVVAGRAESTISGIATEVLKSVFYSLWAY
jgi:uncharacterized SAM-binding protein YcdF (DUF218 family)